MPRAANDLVRLFAIAGIVSCFAGCASTDTTTSSTTASASTPEKSPLDAWVAVFQRGDMTELAAMYSENFKAPAWENKAALVAWLDGGNAQGWWKDLSIDASKSRMLPKGNRESAGPVHLAGAFGAADVYLEFVRENGVWQITQMTMQLY
ncbi:MAG: hypothetical protein AAB353_04740 [Candidatus Hydrogenedentota bacterium]